MSDTEITQIGRPMLLNPATKEVFDLTAPTETLAEWMDATKQLQDDIKEQRAVVTQELLSRMDRACNWTQAAGELKVSAPSPAPTEEWDGAELRTALLELADRGVLDVAAVDAAVETVVTYKPRKAGINQLRRAGGEVAEVVDSLARTVEKPRYVSVRPR